MGTKLALISVAFLLVFAINQTFASPLARTREHAHESNSLVNLNGFMNDLKTKLRGELAMLMALEEEAQGKPDSIHFNYLAVLSFLKLLRLI